MLRRIFAAVLFFLWAHQEVAAGDLPLADMPIDALTNIKVYTASKKNEDPYLSPSAVYVITAEDMQQMGVTHVADALRTVPGFQVTKLSSNKWMVASRGFGEQFSNKLLVLIDGRAIYSTLFSGVVWDHQDMVLDNIKQIEVIRGPGATIWGSNAVNGVINIITKNSADTQGNYANIIAGNYNKIAEFRSGQTLAENNHISISGKLRSNNDFSGVNRPGYQDSWNRGNASFRWDKKVDSTASHTIIGDVYMGEEDQLYKVPVLAAPFSNTLYAQDKFKGFNLNGKTQKSMDNGDLYLSSYIDYNDWTYAFGNFKTSTFYVEAQRDMALTDRHEFSLGTNYKFVMDKIRNTDWFIYTPSTQNTNFLSVFAQDKIALIRKVLFLQLGTKLESNSYDDFLQQPSAKLLWNLDKSNILWASVAKAYRTPSRGTQDLSLQLLGTAGGYVSRIGNDDFKSEKLIAYEIGYRTTPTTGFNIDMTGFFNRYDQLRTFVAGTPFSNIAVPLHIGNKGQADIYGVELSNRWQPREDFWVSASYSFHRLSLALDQSTVDNVFLTDQKKWPQQSFALRASKQIAENLSLNASFYYMDALPSINIKHNNKFDMNLEWKVLENATISFAGENLFVPEHQEYSAPLYGFPGKIGPSFYVKTTVNF